MTRFATPLLLALSLAAPALALATPAHAETRWQANHPLRAQDNIRLDNQNRRITREVRTGQITGAQGAALRSNDHAVRQEERDMAGQNGTHLTGADQRAITQQENANSRAIGR